MCTYPPQVQTYHTQVRTYHMQVRTYNLWNAHRRDMYYMCTNHTPCRVPSTFQS